MHKGHAASLPEPGAQICVHKFNVQLRIASGEHHSRAQLEVKVTEKSLALISFGEGLDFSTSMGKLFYQLSGAFAEFERDCIRERVKAGMRNARAKGRHIGRPRAVVDAARIGQLSALGTPWAKIGRTVGVSARTAKRIALRRAGSV